MNHGEIDFTSLNPDEESNHGLMVVELEIN